MEVFGNLDAAGELSSDLTRQRHAEVAADEFAGTYQQVGIPDPRVVDAGYAEDPVVLKRLTPSAQSAAKVQHRRGVPIRLRTSGTIRVAAR